MYMYVTIRQLSQAACFVRSFKIRTFVEGSSEQSGDTACDYQYLKHIQCIYMYIVHVHVHLYTYTLNYNRTMYMYTYMYMYM